MKKLACLVLLSFVIQPVVACANNESRLVAAAENLMVGLNVRPLDERKMSILEKELERHPLGLKDRNIAYSAKADAINSLLRLKIGTNLYERLESAALSLHDSKDEEGRLFATRVLSKTLRTRKIESRLEAALKNALVAIEKTGDPHVSMLEFFSIAEGLAYLGNRKSVAVLKSAIESDESMWYVKQRAFEALADSMYAEISGNILKYIESDDPIVALNALWVLDTEEAAANGAMAKSAATQFIKVTDVYLKKNETDILLQALLSRLGSILGSAYQLGTFPDELIKPVKTNLAKMLATGKTEVQSYLAFMFGRMADDSDAALFPALLQNENKNIVGSTVLGLARCSPTVIHANKDRLLELIEGDWNRLSRFALFALRRGLGDDIENQSINRDEFLIQRDRIKKAYNAIE